MCETLGNTQARSVYKLTGPNVIQERTTLHLPHQPSIELDSEFVFDRRFNRWGLSMEQGAFTAAGPAWSTGSWVLVGIETDTNPHRTVRLVYTSLGPDAYRSDFQSLTKGGSWRTFSGATCRRMIP
jgi:hypothetical protein